MEAICIWDHVIAIFVWPAPNKYAIQACWMNEPFRCHPAFPITDNILHSLPNEHWRLRWVLFICKSLSTLTSSFWTKTLTWALDFIFNESKRLHIFPLISIFSLPDLTWQTCVILWISRDWIFFHYLDICIYCQLIRLTSEANQAQQSSSALIINEAFFLTL